MVGHLLMPGPLEARVGGVKPDWAIGARYREPPGFG